MKTKCFTIIVLLNLLFGLSANAGSRVNSTEFKEFLSSIEIIEVQTNNSQNEDFKTVTNERELCMMVGTFLLLIPPIEGYMDHTQKENFLNEKQAGNLIALVQSASQAQIYCDGGWSAKETFSPHTIYMPIDQPGLADLKNLSDLKSAIRIINSNAIELRQSLDKQL